MKAVRRIFVSVLIVIGGIVLCLCRPWESGMKGASAALEVFYNVKKADAVNSSTINVRKDGEVLAISTRQRPYMTQSMTLTVPVDTVPLLFHGTVEVQGRVTLRFCANGHEVTASLDQSGYEVDGQYYEGKEPLIRYHNRLYVSAKMLAEAFGGTFSWDSDSNTVTLVSGSTPDNLMTPLPVSYDMRVQGRLTPVQDQGNLGTCWAFAALGALESSLMPVHPWVFSADHMSFMSGYNMSQQDGGDFNMALAYLTAWKGPVLEEDDPYGDGYSPDFLEAKVHLQEAVNLLQKDYEAIKTAILRWGGVQSSFYSDMEFATSNSSYYNAKNASYYYPGKNIANHDIVIVGWDDEYPRENFNVYPDQDGAFLCRNSWGSQFGDGGYFYISYEDTNIAMTNLVYSRVDSTDNYDQIYQSDLLGWLGTMGYGEPGAWFSNVYTASGDEALAAAAFYTTGRENYYDIFVVRDFTDSQSFDTMEYVKSGYIENCGYYTVDFPVEIPLEAGSRFAVVVHLTTKDSLRPVAIEYETGEWTNSVDISDGEGYLSYDGRTWENIESTYQSNACLKAFTNRRESE